MAPAAKAPIVPAVPNCKAPAIPEEEEVVAPLVELVPMMAVALAMAVSFSPSAMTKVVPNVAKVINMVEYCIVMNMCRQEEWKEESELLLGNIIEK